MTVIKHPVLTEKSIQEAQEKNIFLFEVNPAASKYQIAAAIASLYSVTVETVRTHRPFRDTKRTGSRRMMTLQGRSKRAFVTLKKGDTIELFDTMGGDAK